MLLSTLERDCVLLLDSLSDDSSYSHTPSEAAQVSGRGITQIYGY
jgi:hypothetical protein